MGLVCILLMGSKFLEVFISTCTYLLNKIIQFLQEFKPKTPWGEPSDSLIVGKMVINHKTIKLAFLPRHGRGHYLTPTEVPSRANIAALKHVGCKVILVRSSYFLFTDHIHVLRHFRRSDH